MNSTAVEVFQYLESTGIPIQWIEHDPVETIEDCAPIGVQLSALVAKNYFLTTRNKKNIYLCLVRPEARFHSSVVSAELGSSRLSFGSEDILNSSLRTYPGAVTPLGLIFDIEHRVHLVMDRDLLAIERIAFHPCDNTVTIAMNMKDFLSVYLPSIKCDILYVDFKNEKNENS